MSTIHLRIITPQKVIREEDISSVTIPSAEGEITVLPHHTNLFSLIIEGIIKIEKNQNEDFLSIGGGYLQTNGNEVNILVSKAVGQNEIDEKMTTDAVTHAKNLLSQAKSKEERAKAISILRRSVIDLKLLRKRRGTRHSESV